MNISMKQKWTHRHREQTCGCQGGGGQGRDGLWVWDEQMQTIIYRMDKHTYHRSETWWATIKWKVTQFH